MVNYYPGTRGMTNNQQLLANTPSLYTQPDKDKANGSTALYSQPLKPEAHLIRLTSLIYHINQH
jgi:hypothetical protein